MWRVSMENGTKVVETIVQQPNTLDLEFSDWKTYEFSDMAKILALEIWGTYNEDEKFK